MDRVIVLMEEDGEGESRFSFDSLPTAITTTPTTSEDVEEMDIVIDLKEEYEEGESRVSLDNLPTTTLWIRKRPADEGSRGGIGDGLGRVAVG